MPHRIPPSAFAEKFTQMRTRADAFFSEKPGKMRDLNSLAGLWGPAGEKPGATCEIPATRTD
jgi:hypothetical protein